MSKQTEGVDYPKYVNHEYFNSINSERKAYFLGLLFADGCIAINSGNRQKSMYLGLQEKDSYLVKEFCKDICPTKSVTISNPPSHRDKNWQKMVYLKVSSNKLCDALINYGCIPNKSRKGIDFQFSKIEEQFIPHLIRGFLDGDGCVYVKNVKYKYKRKTTYKLSRNYSPKISKKIIFCNTSKPLLEEILKMLQKYCTLTSKPQWRELLRTEIVYHLKIEGQKDVDIIKEFLYKDATIFMQRKLDKFNMTISSQAIDTSIEGSETTGGI